MDSICAQDFEEALKSYNSQLSEDPIISRHLAALYDSLLEQNLLRLIEPFSRVEINHIASLIGLPQDQVRTPPILAHVSCRHCTARHCTVLDLPVPRPLRTLQCTAQCCTAQHCMYCTVLVYIIAIAVGVPGVQVEPKLSQMILDRKFQGTLDQGAGSLVVFADTEQDDLYPTAIETIENMGKVVDGLFVRSKRIMA